MNRFTHVLRRAASGIRAAWLILGAVLLIWFAVEVGYRGLAWVRRAVVGEALPRTHPLYGEAWFAEYTREDYDSEVRDWRPFVYYRRHPYSGRLIHVDSVGHRNTVQQVKRSADGRLRELWMFGGSTMWGFHQREDATIAARVATRLAENGITDVKVTNFGEAGYVFTQEVLELLMQLRAGVRPDVVVFYDGVNEVPALIQSGVAGLPQNELSRARDFRIGRTMFAWQGDLKAELRAAGTLVSLAIGRSRVVGRLQGMVAPPWPGRPVERLSGELLVTYVSTVRIVEMLAREYDFKVLFLWQPNLHGMHKPLGPHEQALMNAIDADPFEADVKAVHLRVDKAIDSAMAGVAPGQFVNLSDVLSGERETLYTDNLGHTIERANGPIVEAFLPALLRLLAAPSAANPAVKGR